MSGPARDLSEFLASGGDLAACIVAAEPVEPEPPAAHEGVFVQGKATWEMSRTGVVRIAPYALRVERDVQGPGGRRLEGVIEQEAGPSIPFAVPAELLGDNRGLRKTLAGLLGARFRAPRGRLEHMVDAWLEASEVKEVQVMHDFGFTSDGSAFVDVNAMLPAGALRFGPPPESSAGRLGLHRGEAVTVARELLTLWPRVLGCPFMTGALLGIVGWGLVAPVLEARDPGVAPLLGFLHGPSGAGKSTHAGVVQCFFGTYADARAAVSFGSTPLSIELEGYLFRGAVMVVGDVKAGAVAEGGAAKVLGLVQRAGDRAERRRLDNTGNALASRRSRATWLFEGEDVPVTEGSALARLLVLSIPEAPRAPALVSRLQMLMPELPAITHALVEHLLTTRPWEALLTRYRAHAELITHAASGAPNAARLGKSIAAVAVGLEVWRGWLNTVGLVAPCEVTGLVDALVGSGAAQLHEVASATPGERFLELVRQLLASGVARLGYAAEGGELIGEWKADHSVAYLIPEATLGRIRRHFPDAAAGQAPAASIAADLMRMGALAESDPNRRTKKARVGGKAVNTWAVRGALLEG